ncbi:hypothetical protein TorRG33x02_004850, partial [Trema orientale]
MNKANFVDLIGIFNQNPSNENHSCQGIILCRDDDASFRVLQIQRCEFEGPPKMTTIV